MMSATSMSVGLWPHRLMAAWERVGDMVIVSDSSFNYLEVTIRYLAAVVPVESVESLPELLFMVLSPREWEGVIFRHFQVWIF